MATVEAAKMEMLRQRVAQLEIALRESLAALQVDQTASAQTALAAATESPERRAGAGLGRQTVHVQWRRRQVERLERNLDAAEDAWCLVHCQPQPKTNPVTPSPESLLPRCAGKREEGEEVRCCESSFFIVINARFTWYDLSGTMYVIRVVNGLLSLSVDAESRISDQGHIKKRRKTNLGSHYRWRSVAIFTHVFHLSTETQFNNRAKIAVTSCTTIDESETLSVLLPKHHSFACAPTFIHQSWTL